MTDQDIIDSLQQHRLQRSAQQMQGLVAAAMFGTQASVPAAATKPSMEQILAQVTAAEQQANMNFQNPNDQQAQNVLGILLDL